MLVVRFLLRGLIVMLLLVGSFLPIAQPVEASLPPDSQSVYPQAGPPGTIFFFSASSFRSERVGYWFNAPDGTISSNKYRYAAYAYEGRVDWRWQAPYDALPGWWTVVVRGEESELQQVIPFEVTAPVSGVSHESSANTFVNPDGTTVQPAVAPPGTNFTFTVKGLDGERVGYWLTDPNGNIQGDDERFWFKMKENPVIWNWKSPDNATLGIWTITVRGEESGIDYSIRFEIRRPPETPPLDTVPVNAPCVGAVEPAFGGPNTEFAFFVTGFPPRTHVHYWAEDPNGRKYGYDEGSFIGSNPDGRVDISWSAPDNAVYGYWTMYFLSTETGKNPSRIERVISFEVRRPGDTAPGPNTSSPPCARTP